MKQLRQRQNEGEPACWVTLPQAYLFLLMFGEGRGRGGNFSRLEIQEALSLLSICVQGLQPHVPGSVVPKGRNV